MGDLEVILLKINITNYWRSRKSTGEQLDQTVESHSERDRERFIAITRGNRAGSVLIQGTDVSIAKGGEVGSGGQVGLTVCTSCLPTRFSWLTEPTKNNSSIFGLSSNALRAYSLSTPAFLFPSCTSSALLSITIFVAVLSKKFPVCTGD